MVSLIGKGAAAGPSKTRSIYLIPSSRVKFTLRASEEDAIAGMDEGAYEECDGSLKESEGGSGLLEGKYTRCSSAVHRTFGAILAMFINSLRS